LCLLILQTTGIPKPTILCDPVALQCSWHQHDDDDDDNSNMF